MKGLVSKIVSGGQTGVDRAALDFAIEQEIPHGGYCPKGRRAEDGPLPKRYQLNETESADYPDRTEKNVLISDGTLILDRGTLTGGTAYTQQLCRQHHKPLLVINLNQDTEEVRSHFRQWLQDNDIKVMNVAGSRESKFPIYEQAKTYLHSLFDE